MKIEIKYWNFKCKKCGYKTDVYFFPDGTSAEKFVKCDKMNKLYILTMGNKLVIIISKILDKLLKERYKTIDDMFFMRNGKIQKMWNDVLSEIFEEFCICSECGGKIEVPREPDRCPNCNSKKWNVTTHDLIPTPELEILVCKDEDKIKDENITKSIRKNKLFKKLINSMEKAIEIDKKNMLFYNMTK